MDLVKGEKNTPPPYMYMYKYIYIYVCVCVCVCVYIYISFSDQHSNRHKCPFKPPAIPSPLMRDGHPPHKQSIGG